MGGCRGRGCKGRVGLGLRRAGEGDVQCHPPPRTPLPPCSTHTHPNRRAAGVIARLRQGPAVGGAPVDCGAMCMPGLAEKVQELVDDAVKKGAQVRGVLCVSCGWVGSGESRGLTLRFVHACAPTPANPPPLNPPPPTHPHSTHPRQPTPQLVAGGQLPPRGAGGQFYPPTLLTGVKPSMRIWQEEVFGPVMCGKGPGV